MTGLVFANNYKVAEEQLIKIKEQYDCECIFVDNKFNCYKIIMANGDIWTARVLADDCQGLRANIVYVDYRCVTDAFSHNVDLIKEIATKPPYNAIRQF